MRKLTRAGILKRWREYVELVVRAVRDVAPQAKVYLVGGAAEGRLTVLSGVDILVVLPRDPSFDEAVEIRAEILERAEELGLPPHAPIDLHIVGKDSLRGTSLKAR